MNFLVLSTYRVNEEELVSKMPWENLHAAFYHLMCLYLDGFIYANRYLNVLSGSNTKMTVRVDSDVLRILTSNTLEMKPSIQVLEVFRRLVGAPADITVFSGCRLFH